MKINTNYQETKEKTLLNTLWKQEIENDKIQKELTRQAELKLRSELLKSNKSLINIKQHKKEEEKKRDKQLLDFVLRKEREQIELENLRKVKLNSFNMPKYNLIKDALKNERMEICKNVVDNNQLERILERETEKFADLENERQWKKRTDIWRQQEVKLFEKKYLFISYIKLI